MKRVLPFVVFTLLVRVAFAAEKPTELPWRVNKPIVTVKKELYRKSPRPGTGAFVTMEYVGPNLELLETYSANSSDVLTDVKQRLSTDNGKTWSAFQPLPDTIVKYNGVEVREIPGMARFYDAQAGVLVETWTQLLSSWHTFWRVSRDYGATWSPRQLLRYEAGDDFDPNNPLNPGYILTNRGYGGNNIIKLSNGKLLTSVGWAKTDGGGYSSSLCYIGTWNPAAKDYQWTPSNRITAPPDKSALLVESEVAEFKDGRVLVAWRGKQTSTTPGRKWYSVSTDGGMTLSPVAELKYDDGSSFYSPESYHRMIRYSLTGKLYWIGNITATPPVGPLPRFPLVIAEVDETGATPALKKSTVTMIDGPPPGQDESEALSNFSLLENRESHVLELYLTLYGEFASNTYDADCYRYLVTLQ